MIKVFFQYSYGGYKTLAIQCVDDELLDNEVTNDNLCDFPDDAHCYFQYGGSKIVYRYLNDGRLDLVVREIPSIHKDGSGRPIPFAVQFIGEKQDRKTMDCMVVDIANDVNKFHDFISDLFYVRGGLHFEGDKLSQWIDAHNVRCEITKAALPQIKQITKINSGVIFFVALSGKFGVDEHVTANVSKELNLPFEQMKKDACFIDTIGLSKVQGQSEFSLSANDKLECDEPTVKDGETDKEKIELLTNLLQEKNKEIADLKEKVNTHFDTIANLNSKLDEKENESVELNRQLKLNKKYLYIALGAAGVLAIVSIFSIFSK